MEDSTPRWRALVLALALSIGLPLVAQATTPRAPVAAPDGGERPARICVLGASVSDGFLNPFPREDGESDATVRLREALAVAWPAASWDDRATAQTFMSPQKIQAPRVAAALAAVPDLVIGLDYPFWFGYGRTVRIDGETEAAARCRQQSAGLALLDGYEGALLLGDYPLIREADPRMLPRSLIPSQAAADALNAGLRGWADRRERTALISLADFFDAVIAERGLAVHTVGEDGEPCEVFVPRDWLMQGDGLHTSRMGVAILAREIAGQVRTLLPEGHVARPLQLPLSAYLEAARAAVDWADMLEFDERAKVRAVPAEKPVAEDPAGTGKRGDGR